MPPDYKPFDRPNLSDDERINALAASLKISNMGNRDKRLKYILALMVENISLIKECNNHRASLGIQPLRVYPIDASRIG